MSDINVWVGTGNLTRDPELTATPSGTQVLRFGIACNAAVKNKQTGQWDERPDFVDCVLWGQRAQSLSQIMRKGMRVTVRGRLHYSRWQGQDGKNRSKLEVYADEVVLPPKGAAQPSQGANPAPKPQPPTSYQAAPQSAANAPSAPQAAISQAPMGYRGQQQPPAADVYDEDIPF